MAVSADVSAALGLEVGAALGLGVAAMVGVEVSMAVGLVIGFSVGWGCVGAPARAGDVDWRWRQEHQSASVRKKRAFVKQGRW